MRNSKAMWVGGNKGVDLADEQKHNFISTESIIEFQSGESFNVVESGFDLAAGKKSAVQVDNGCNNNTELVRLIVSIGSN